MLITSKGQVTIPIEIRRKMGLLPHTDVEFLVEDNAVKIVKAETQRKSRGSRAVGALNGKATINMTTDEILALTREP